MYRRRAAPYRNVDVARASDRLPMREPELRRAAEPDDSREGLGRQDRLHRTFAGIVMKRVIIAISLSLAAIIAVAAWADVWDGDAIQGQVDAQYHGWRTPEEMQARMIAILYGLPWPARQVARSRDGRIKVFVKVDGG